MEYAPDDLTEAVDTRVAELGFELVDARKRVSRNRTVLQVRVDRLEADSGTCSENNWISSLLNGSAMMRTPVRRLLPSLATLPPRERLAALGWITIIRWTGDLAKMFGYGCAVVGGGLRQQSYAFQTKIQWFCGSQQAAMSRRCA